MQTSGLGRVRGQGRRRRRDGDRDAFHVSRLKLVFADPCPKHWTRFGFLSKFTILTQACGRFSQYKVQNSERGSQRFHKRAKTTIKGEYSQSPLSKVRKYGHRTVGRSVEAQERLNRCRKGPVPCRPTPLLVQLQRVRSAGWQRDKWRVTHQNNC